MHITTTYKCDGPNGIDGRPCAALGIVTPARLFVDLGWIIRPGDKHYCGSCRAVIEAAELEAESKAKRKAGKTKVTVLAAASGRMGRKELRLVQDADGMRYEIEVVRVDPAKNHMETWKTPDAAVQVYYSINLDD